MCPAGDDHNVKCMPQSHCGDHHIAHCFYDCLYHINIYIYIYIYILNYTCISIYVDRVFSKEHFQGTFSKYAPKTSAIHLLNLNFGK